MGMGTIKHVLLFGKLTFDIHTLFIIYNIFRAPIQLAAMTKSLYLFPFIRKLTCQNNVCLVVFTITIISLSTNITLGHAVSDHLES